MLRTVPADLSMARSSRLRAAPARRDAAAGVDRIPLPAVRRQRFLGKFWLVPMGGVAEAAAARDWRVPVMGNAIEIR